VQAAEKAKNWERVVFYLDRLLAGEPGNGNYLLQRARANIAQGHADEADADYRKALEVDPVTVLADHEEQIRGFERTRQWPQIVSCFDRMIAVSPENGKFYDGRAWTHFRLGHWDQAIADYTKAIDLDFARELGTRGWALWYNRGQAHASLGAWEKAAADFVKASEWQQVPGHSLLMLAQVRLQQGDDKGYRRACADLLAKHGKTTDQNEANTVAWACSLVPDAVADFTVPLDLARLAVNKAPKEHAILNTLGTLLYRAGKDAEAIEMLTRAIQAHGKGGTPADWLILALAHQRRGQPEEARRWLDKAVAEMDRKEFNDALNWSSRIEYQLFRREAESGVPKPRP
jgi:tetratricopeptide (TPR) repeat protein